MYSEKTQCPSVAKEGIARSWDFLPCSFALLCMKFLSSSFTFQPSSLIYRFNPQNITQHCALWFLFIQQSWGETPGSSLLFNFLNPKLFVAIKTTCKSAHPVMACLIFIYVLPIISVFPYQPDILHALAHCLLEPVEFSRVVMYSPLTFFFLNFIIRTLLFSPFTSFLICT